MTQEELNRIIDSDSYFAARKDPSEAEIRLFLREVDFHCPLCGIELQKTASELEEHTVLRLAPGGDELFGRSWSNQASKG